MSTNEINQTIESSIQSYLRQLKTRGSITDHNQVECRHVVHTWETLYPDRHARLVAIAAHERWGSELNESAEPEAHAFPYRKIVLHWHEGLDSDGEQWSDYRGSSDTDYDPEADPPPPGATEFRVTLWRMAVPHENLEVQFSFLPVKPIKHLQLNFECSDLWSDE